jgi:hypothetical protein
LRKQQALLIFKTLINNAFNYPFWIIIFYFIKEICMCFKSLMRGKSIIFFIVMALLFVMILSNCPSNENNGDKSTEKKTINIIKKDAGHDFSLTIEEDPYDGKPASTSDIPIIKDETDNDENYDQDYDQQSEE